MAVWTKIQKNQPLTLYNAQVKHIIEGKQPPEPTQNPAASAVRLIAVDEDGAGQRLDNFLMRHLKGVPKTHVYRIIRSGEVRVNKGRADAATRLALGDSVRLPPLRLSERAEEKAEAMARSTPARSFPVL